MDQRHIKSTHTILKHCTSCHVSDIQSRQKLIKYNSKAFYRTFCRTGTQLVGLIINLGSKYSVLNHCLYTKCSSYCILGFSKFFINLCSSWYFSKTFLEIVSFQLEITFMKSKLRIKWCFSIFLYEWK